MKKFLVITGASQGIGLATARCFLANGFVVINLARRSCPLTQVISLPVDLADIGLKKTLQPRLLPLLTEADLISLVHNAARLEKDTVARIEAEELREILQVNVVAPTILNRLVLPLMKPGSSLIYLGSTLSEKAVGGTFSYVISKHAAVGMMRASGQDLIETGIHTACVCPGFTDTPMLRSHLNHSAMALEQIKGMNAQNRLIDPDEIAQTIYFAATHPVINGAVIHANLGQRER